MMRRKPPVTIILLRLFSLGLGLGASVAAAENAPNTALGDAPKPAHDKPAQKKAHRLGHAKFESAKQQARHDGVTSSVMRTPLAQPQAPLSQSTGMPVRSTAPNEFWLGDVLVTTHGYLGLTVGGTTR